MKVTLAVSSNNQGKAWLNGKEVFKFVETRTLEKDTDKLKSLAKGQNILVLKVVNEVNNWQGCARFLKDGVPVRTLESRWHPGGPACRRAPAEPSPVVLFLASLLFREAADGGAAGSPSDISSDGRVVFFPGVAVATGAGSFDAHIRGWIFEPLKETSKSANESVAAFVRLLVGLDRGALPLDQLRNRGKLLFVDPANQKIPIDIAGRRAALAALEPGGHFEDRVALQGVQRALGGGRVSRRPRSPATIAHLPGNLQLVATTGLSIVSDIDDTIKDSNVQQQARAGVEHVHSRLPRRSRA